MNAVSILELLCIFILSTSTFVKFYSQYQEAILVPSHRVSEPTDPVVSNASLINGFNTLTQSNPAHSGVFHFIQVSDIHISKYSRHGGHYHFLHFLKSILPHIQPEFVILTGDITDAKDENHLTSRQFYDEWSAYYQALHDANVFNRPHYWWDLRGNHDCFNVFDWHSEENYFKNMSRVRKAGFTFQYRLLNQPYLFIGLDGCPLHGFGRPFNFFGIYDALDVEFLEHQLSLREALKVQHTFVFGHYPIGTTFRSASKHGTVLEDVLGNASTYMCGHLHRFKWRDVHHMYHYHPSGYLELELGDMKKHAVYRIVLLDQNHVIFRDLELPAPPVPLKPGIEYTFHGIDPVPVPPHVVISHPKDLRYYLPHHEPALPSDWPFHAPIRFFLFSPAIAHSRFEWNNSIHCLAFDDTSPAFFSIDVPLSAPTLHLPNSRAPATSRALFTHRWPEAFNATQCPIFVLYIRVRDVKTGLTDEHRVRVNLIEQTLSRLPLQVGGLGEFLISIDHSKFFKTLFFSFYSFLFLLLLVPKLFVLCCFRTTQPHELLAYQSQSILYLRSLQKRKWTDFIFFLRINWLRFVLLATKSLFWYPLFLMTLSYLVVPYFEGDLVSGHFASFYLTGVYLAPNWVPILDTWFFGVSQLVSVTLPFVFYFSFHLMDSKKVYLYGTRAVHPLHEWKSIHALVLFAIGFHMYNIYMLHLFYGSFVFFSSLTLDYTLMTALLGVAFYKKDAYFDPISRHTVGHLRRLSGAGTESNLHSSKEKVF